jgi:SAM-dependent methyltransferase
MEDYDPREYGARWAGQYDDWHAGMMDDEGAVAVLGEFAGDGGGPILEFGVGTGRLAVPLARRGFEVVGVDISEEMLAQLRAKPGAEGVTTVTGDMTTIRLDREFGVAFIAFSSICVLPTQGAQVEFFRNAAAHLRPGGRFVLETATVSGQNRQHLRPVKIESDRLVLSAGEVDPVTSFYTGTWVVLEPGGTSFYPVRGRSVGHQEMDLMAQLAGLRLENRWGNWDKGEFTADSRLHVSVYRKDDPATRPSTP